MIQSLHTNAPVFFNSLSIEQLEALMEIGVHAFRRVDGNVDLLNAQAIRLQSDMDVLTGKLDGATFGVPAGKCQMPGICVYPIRLVAKEERPPIQNPAAWPFPVGLGRGLIIEPAAPNPSTEEDAFNLPSEEI